MKELKKLMARYLSKTYMSYAQCIFKAMMTRILTGLDKIVEYMSETVNTKIRDNIAKIKCSNNEMKCG